MVCFPLGEVRPNLCLELLDFYLDLTLVMAVSFLGSFVL
jgi:hypothetical protein